MAKKKERTKSSKKTTAGRVKKKRMSVDFGRDDIALAIVEAKVPKKEQRAYVSQIYQNAGVKKTAADTRAYQALKNIEKYGLKPCAKDGEIDLIKQYLPKDPSLEERTKKAGRKKKTETAEQTYEEPAAPEESYDAPDQVSAVMGDIDYSRDTLSKLMTVKGLSGAEKKRAAELIGNVEKSMDYLTEDANKLKNYVDDLKDNYVEAKKTELEKQKTDFEAQQEKTQAELEAMLK